MIIVVADHGMHFEANGIGRTMEEGRIGDIGFVPLLIKYPGQIEGTTESSNVQTIDIAPTVMDVLGATNAASFDGRSLIDPGAIPPETKIIMNKNDRIFEFSFEEALGQRQRMHQEFIDLFSLADSDATLWQYGPGMSYLGKEELEIALLASPATIDSDATARFSAYDPNAMMLPLLVTGTVDASASQDDDLDDAVILLAMNGTIVAQGPTYTIDNERRFYTMVPEGVPLPGENRLQFYLIPGEDAPNR